MLRGKFLCLCLRRSEVPEYSKAFVYVDTVSSDSSGTVCTQVGRVCAVCPSEPGRCGIVQCSIYKYWSNVYPQSKGGRMQTVSTNHQIRSKSRHDRRRTITFAFSFSAQRILNEEVDAKNRNHGHRKPFKIQIYYRISDTACNIRVVCSMPIYFFKK